MKLAASKFLACFLLLAFLSLEAPGQGSAWVRGGYLTDRDFRLIEKYWGDYAYAQKRTGVPLLILAAIHYRESSLHTGHYSKTKKKVLKNIGGPFMVDFGPRNDHAEFARRVRVYEKKIHALYYGSGVAPKVSHDFRFAVLAGAHHLKEKARCSMAIDSCLSDAVWGYNGKAKWQKSEKDSAYVWSDPKAGILMMVRFRGRRGELVEFEDTRPGVMILYHELVSKYGEGHAK